jgi:hypothetical protein
MAYRVIQWATGNVGRHAMRGIIEHPETELAGVFVYSAEKVGRDAGEICGIGTLGVTTTNNEDAIAALDADCVLYAPLLPDLAQICRLLESGKSVVTTCGYFYPASLGSEVVAALETACRAGKACLHGTGINPGGASDQLALVVSGLAYRIDSIEIEEFSDLRNYDAPGVVFDLLGFGKPPETAKTNPMLDILGTGFRQSIDMVAAGLQIVLEGYDATHAVAVATAPIHAPVGTIDEGMIAGQRFSWSGTVGGRPIITTTVNWLMGEQHLQPAWRLGTEGWEIRVEGDPPVRCHLKTAWPSITPDPTYRRDHGVIATAMHAVNAIPYVCEAPPGIHTFLDLPMLAGRALAPGSHGS